MHYLIGIDDTDDLTSRGTGFRARCLIETLQKSGLAFAKRITRHQLLVDPSIPYTSHNSAACLALESGGNGFQQIVDFCRDFLYRESAPGSDTGLCVVPVSDVNPTITAFGQSAKETVLQRDGALALAREAGIFLQGLTGDHGGVIGALAAVGLSASGNDGRFIWAQGLRELDGIHTAEDLLSATGIEVIQDREGVPVPKNARINVEPWPRPVLLRGQAVLLVERSPTSTPYEWQLLPKEIIRRY
ncbi:MAG: ABC transporter substrate-binding protein [Anaerolineae bacterium]